MGETRSRKVGPECVLIDEKDATMVAWTLHMQECKLSINLQCLQMKVKLLFKYLDQAHPFQWWNSKE
jgi:hypothetical protein